MIDVMVAPEAAAAASRGFVETGKTRVADFLLPAVAKRLHAMLGDDAPWWRTFNQRDKSWDLGPESLAVMDDAKAQAIAAFIHKGAQRSFQYLYGTIRVFEDSKERLSRNLPVDQMVESFNSLSGLALFRTLTGNPAVSLVDGQATRYLPGHFLTRHDDSAAGKSRIAAYVLNLSPEWRPEWGGLLLFHAPDGEVTEGFVPRFNTLNIFRVPQSHSVSMVTPFAPAPRLAITGWIRTGAAG